MSNMHPIWILWAVSWNLFRVCTDVMASNTPNKGNLDDVIHLMLSIVLCCLDQESIYKPLWVPRLIIWNMNNFCVAGSFTGCGCANHATSASGFSLSSSAWHHPQGCQGTFWNLCHHTSSNWSTWRDFIDNSLMQSALVTPFLAFSSKDVPALLQKCKSEVSNAT